MIISLLVGFSLVICRGVVSRAIGSVALRATVAHGEEWREQNQKSWEKF